MRTQGRIQALLADHDAERDAELLGVLYEVLLGHEIGDDLTLVPGLERRRAGAHYTPRPVARFMVEATLRPLLERLGPGATPEQIVALKICDPSMGSGVFLQEACRLLADRLLRAWKRAGAARKSIAQARHVVAQWSLYGVDRDPLAVALARLSMWLLCRSERAPLSFVDHTLREGDALTSFRWRPEFPEVFAASRRGFDAFVGNPPWVSYAGRASQPLDEATRRLYERSPAFAGFRNLQGLFVHQGARLLRPGGRLGFVLPTSMSDLDGYEPSRRAHDVLCACDEQLPDLEDGGFAGVFQPCMGLLSTRRQRPVIVERAGPWPLHRSDLDPEAIELLEHLASRPLLPPELFSDRGFQTERGDTAHLLPAPRGEGFVGVRVGGDIDTFTRRPPRLHCDPSLFGKRFRPPSAWKKVHILLRQTARYPIAQLSDGLPFRNSILAGFGRPPWSASLLVAYLNATPLRCFHFLRHRDARQGMPQLKIAHLRALPAPDPTAPAARALARLGRLLAERNEGLRPGEQEALDELAADALGLPRRLRERARRWAADTG